MKVSFSGSNSNGINSPSKNTLNCDLRGDDTSQKYGYKGQAIQGQGTGRNVFPPLGVIKILFGSLLLCTCFHAN